jgi:hypothetical protein
MEEEQREREGKDRETDCTKASQVTCKQPTEGSEEMEETDHTSSRAFLTSRNPHAYRRR